MAVISPKKFGRNYNLVVDMVDGGQIQIAPPFTIEFDINRNTLSSVNYASIRIYNLSKFNRDQIEFNIYNQTTFRRVTLEAGYGDGLVLIFNGTITQAWSVREGTNFITQIESFDGGYAFNNAIFSQSFPAGTPNKLVIQTMIASLAPYGIIPGVVGDYPGVTARGQSYSGPTCALLQQLSNKGFFIDLGVAHALGNSECLAGAGSVPIINAASGLIGTPVREQQILTFDMVFEPYIQAGQIINLQSSTISGSFATQAVNGLYKVTSVKHRAMISQAVCGDAITTLGMFLGEQGPAALKVAV